MATTDDTDLGLGEGCTPSRTKPHEHCPGCGRSFHDEPEGHIVSHDGALDQYCRDCCPRCPT